MGWYVVEVCCYLLSYLGSIEWPPKDLEKLAPMFWWDRKAAGEIIDLFSDLMIVFLQDLFKVQ